MQDYTYIVARLRSLEALMPDRAWFQRLARTPEEGLLPILRERFKGFERIDSPYDFESGIEAERAAALDLTSSLIADDGTVMFLRGRYDFDNITHMMKARMLGRNGSLTSTGLVDPEIVERAVTDGDWALLPRHLKEFGRRLGAVAESAGVAAVEYEGEAGKWRFLLERAPGRIAGTYIGWKIDLANIKNFIRLKRISLRREEPERAWIAGGRIETGRLRALSKEPEEVFHSFLEYTAYRALIGLGLSNETPLRKIDTILDRFLLGLLGESRYRFFDIAPVLYHLELRERDEHLLRVILTGVLNCMPEEIIAGRVDEFMPS